MVHGVRGGVIRGALEFDEPRGVLQRHNALLQHVHALVCNLAGLSATIRGVTKLAGGHLNKWAPGPNTNNTARSRWGTRHGAHSHDILAT